MARNADVNSKSEVGGVGTPIKTRQDSQKGCQRVPRHTKKSVKNGGAEETAFGDVRSLVQGPKNLQMVVWNSLK